MSSLDCSIAVIGIDVEYLTFLFATLVSCNFPCLSACVCFCCHSLPQSSSIFLSPCVKFINMDISPKTSNYVFSGVIFIFNCYFYSFIELIWNMLYCSASMCFCFSFIEPNFIILTNSRCSLIKSLSGIVLVSCFILYFWSPILSW